MTENSLYHRPSEVNMSENRDDFMYTITEDYSSIWGFSFNRSLEKAPEKISDYRYISIIKKVGGKDKIVGSGIWSIEEAEEVIKTSKDGKFSEIYSFYADLGSLIFISFYCNKKVFAYLEGQKLFTKKKGSPGYSFYSYDHPFLLGEEKPSLKVEINNFKIQDKDNIKITDYFKNYFYILMKVSKI